MENVAEAMKIAFGVLLFVIALTLSISCLSQATSAVGTIVTLRDSHIDYIPIKPSNGLTRIVGIDTIIPTMYNAYSENIEIYFLKADGTPLPIYYKIDEKGERRKDENTNLPIEVNYINLAEEGFGSEGKKLPTEVAKEHLDMILAVGISNKSYFSNQEMVNKYENQFHERYPMGFYEYIKDKKFEECLGEYYQGSDSATATSSTQIKKRVITYKEQ